MASLETAPSAAVRSQCKCSARRHRPPLLFCPRPLLPSGPRPRFLHPCQQLPAPLRPALFPLRRRPQPLLRLPSRRQWGRWLEACSEAWQVGTVFNPGSLTFLSGSACPLLPQMSSRAALRLPHAHFPPVPCAALAAAACALVLCKLRRRRRGAAPGPEEPAKPDADLGSKGLDSIDTDADSFMRQHMFKQKCSAAGRLATDSAAGSPAGSARIGAAAGPCSSSSKADVSRTDELLSWVSLALCGQVTKGSGPRQRAWLCSALQRHPAGQPRLSAPPDSSQRTRLKFCMIHKQCACCACCACRSPATSPPHHSPTSMRLLARGWRTLARGAACCRAAQGVAAAAGHQQRRMCCRAPAVRRSLQAAALAGRGHACLTCGRGCCTSAACAWVGGGGAGREEAACGLAGIA